MYFDSCRNLNDLKSVYKKLAMEHHPDRGGDLRIMQAVNSEYDRVFAVLKDLQNIDAERPETKTRKTTETPGEFRAIVDMLLKLSDVEVELCGSWLWISGDTYRHREALKSCGCRWSSTKKRWYWHHAEDDCRRSRGSMTMKEIRKKYGSKWLANERAAKLLPA